MMFSSYKLFKAILLPAIFLSNAALLYAAADDSPGALQHALTSVKSHPYVVAATAGASALGGYALADYCDKLPAWMPSLAPVLKDVKKYCIEHPGNAASIGLTGICSIGFIISLIKLNELKTTNHFGLRILAMQLPEHDNDAPAACHTRPLETTETHQTMIFLNQYAREIPSDQLLPEIPQCIVERCAKYLKPLPVHLHNIAQKAVRDVGLSDPVFFYETSMVTHAIDEPFFRIGFHLSQIAVFDPTYQKIFIDLDKKAMFENDFYRALYHELCHIKGRHTEKDFVSIFQEKKDTLSAHKVFWEKKKISNIRREYCSNGAVGTCALCDKINQLNKVPKRSKTLYGRYQELEAELGAVYFLWRIHNISIVTFDAGYPKDDDFHATGKDQNRYNRKLLERLSVNPELDYMAVQGLAKEYLLEKEPWFAILLEDEDEPQTITASSSS